MQNASPLDDGGWAKLLARLAVDTDLAVTALATKAFIRPRGVPSADNLLRLALAYATGGIGLRAVATWAESAGVASVSDVALLDRLRNCGDWLELLWQKRLAARVPSLPLPQLGLAVRLIDATTVSSPGSRGTDWRLHMDYRPLEGRFDGAVLTDGRQAEGFHLFDARPGELLIGDRAYAKAKGLDKVRRSGGHFLVRIGWRSLVLLDTAGQNFDLLGTLAALPRDRTAEFTVQLASDHRLRQAIGTARLILAPLPEGAGAGARLKAARKAKRQGRRVLAHGAAAADWLMVLTSVGADLASAEQLVELYRLRWQIELGFKRLKSLLRIDELAAKDPKLVRTWLYANLLAALLIEDDTPNAADSPPCAVGTAKPMALVRDRLAQTAASRVLRTQVTPPRGRKPPTDRASES